MATKVSLAQCGVLGSIALGIAVYDYDSGMFFSLGVLIAVLPYYWQMYKLEKAGLLVSEALLRNTEIIKFLVTGMLFVLVFWVFTQVLLGWLFSGAVLGYLSWLGLLQVQSPEAGE
ncbi:MAG: hypothetical protein HOL98_11855 [Gammaproteobacteria bacterium]|nr:hypothetical protein [Gammaproteobacteria bacterium]MBT5204140.1 hypothetical protein [Gammaproteobacteria bacterium]MBT5601328.1 hypothetical protein [Gammaproteobacteria bacterium]MBT6244245.1 hypothetical protein [Gammaproteobacteria bacterium]